MSPTPSKLLELALVKSLLAATTAGERKVKREVSSSPCRPRSWANNGSQVNARGTKNGEDLEIDIQYVNEQKTQSQTENEAFSS